MKAQVITWLLLVALLPAGVCAGVHPDFSGTWKQDDEHSTPKRSGDVTLQITQRDPDMTVETTVVSKSGEQRHALQRYTTDGTTSVSTGADGDEFHTAVTWKDGSLVFAIEEHEDGRILRSIETWTLLKDGAVLQRVRQPADGGVSRTILYIR